MKKLSVYRNSVLGGYYAHLAFINEDLHISNIPVNAIIITKAGKVDQNGKYAAIEVKRVIEGHGEDIYYDVYNIVKTKKVRTQKLYPYDQPSNTAPAKLRKYERVLQTVINKLGISYLDSVGLFKLTDSVPAIAWGENFSKEECILINPKILEHGVKHLQHLIQWMVLAKILVQKEMSKERAMPAASVMAALGLACRMMATDGEHYVDDDFLSTMKWLIGHESLKDDPIRTLYPEEGVTKSDLDIYSAWSALFERGYAPTWTKTIDEDAFKQATPEISLDHLYWLFKVFFREDKINGLGTLGEVGSKTSDGNILFGQHPHSSEKIQNFEQKVVKSTLGKKYSNALSQLSKELTEDKKQSSFESTFKKFLEQIQTQKVLQDAQAQLLSELSDVTRMLPAPNNLTNKGLIMMSCGFEGVDYPFYYCKAPDSGKKKIAAFFDISPSMRDFCGHMCSIVDAVNKQSNLEFAGSHIFAGAVKKLNDKEFKDFRNGTFQYGHSTSFEAVLQFVKEEIKDLDVILVFTDGESGLSQEIIDWFNTSNKKCYNIYFSHVKTNIKSDLDNLTGKSFTITIPHDN